jgi:heme exporter protein D
MSFYFNSLQDFFWMDGHGPYVWASYAVTIVVFIGLAAAPLLRKASFVKRQRALNARQSSPSEVIDNASS